MTKIDLYSNAKVKRVFCSKKGYIEYIEKPSNWGDRLRGFYALFTHEKQLIGTCMYQSGIDRFCEYSEMTHFLISDNITYKPETNTIIYQLGGIRQ